MLDVLNTALYYPSNDHVYFFRGAHYIKYKPGGGVVPLNGSILRRIGIDGWTSFPSEFRSGIDAALYYPSRTAAYFFKGSSYIKYRPGDGVEAFSDGRVIRGLGVDGWTGLPDEFKTGIDAAVYYRARAHAYFFKGDQYVKYKLGDGAVPLNGSKIRRLGVDGWQELPAHFKEGVDAVLEYEPNDRTYFFRGREYARWNPGEGLDPRYPRRFGLIHGLDMLDGSRGGWFGLSNLIAGPMVSHVTSHLVRIWMWLADRAARDRIILRVNGDAHAFTVDEPDGTALQCGMNSVWCGSGIVFLTLDKLLSDRRYDVSIELDGTVLDSVTFTTAPAAGRSGRLAFVFGSCSDMSQYADVPVFERMSECKADFAILCGDNCYYVNGMRTTCRTGPAPRDWESVCRMLLRQLQARNHPQFTNLSRTTPILTTWDDHDFAYNNAAGNDSHNYWVGREVAAAVFRAMWPNDYVTTGNAAIYHTFRWGPVELFVTDTRFHKNESAESMWGRTQLNWLLVALRSSDAPVKILVTATQFLFNAGSQEGHAGQAPAERETILDAVNDGSIAGRLLILSGDVHFTELMRLPGRGTAELLEFTSSPMRRDVSGAPRSEKLAGSRIWAAKRDMFGFVVVKVTGAKADGTVEGSIVLEARDSSGSEIGASGVILSSTWDLATGALS